MSALDLLGNRALVERAQAEHATAMQPVRAGLARVERGRDSLSYDGLTSASASTVCAAGAARGALRSSNSRNGSALACDLRISSIETL